MRPRSTRKRAHENRSIREVALRYRDALGTIGKSGIIDQLVKAGKMKSDIKDRDYMYRLIIG